MCVCVCVYLSLWHQTGQPCFARFLFMQVCRSGVCLRGWRHAVQSYTETCLWHRHGAQHHLVANASATSSGHHHFQSSSSSLLSVSSSFLLSLFVRKCSPRAVMIIIIFIIFVIIVYPHKRVHCYLKTIDGTKCYSSVHLMSV